MLCYKGYASVIEVAITMIIAVIRIGLTDKLVFYFSKRAKSKELIFNTCVVKYSMLKN